MAANPIVRFHDLATGEIIDRPMTDAEKAAKAASKLIIRRATG